MTRSGISRLARVLNPSGCGFDKRVFALLSLNAYIDMSSDQPRGITSVAGYVATLDEWAAVESKWNSGIQYWNKLDGFRELDGFHMSELARKIGKHDAELCIKYFSNILIESRVHAIGAAIFDVDWHQDDWGDGDQIKKLSSPYEQALDLILQVLGASIQTGFPQCNVDVVFCHDDKHQCIQAVYYRQRENFPMFGSMTIDTPNNIVLLQCADLGAGCLRRSWAGILKDHPEAEDLPWGDLPSGAGTAPRTAFWSLRQGRILARVFRTYDRKLGGLDFG